MDRNTLLQKIAIYEEKLQEAKRMLAEIDSDTCKKRRKYNYIVGATKPVRKLNLKRVRQTVIGGDESESDAPVAVTRVVVTDDSQSDVEFKQ